MARFDAFAGVRPGTGLPDAGISAEYPGKRGWEINPSWRARATAVRLAAPNWNMGDVLLDSVEGYDEVVGGPLVGCADGGRVQHRDRELTVDLR